MRCVIEKVILRPTNKLVQLPRTHLPRSYDPWLGLRKFSKIGGKLTFQAFLLVENSLPWVYPKIGPKSFFIFFCENAQNAMRYRESCPMAHEYIRSTPQNSTHGHKTAGYVSGNAQKSVKKVGNFFSNSNFQIFPNISNFQIFPK